MGSAGGWVAAAPMSYTSAARMCVTAAKVPTAVGGEARTRNAVESRRRPLRERSGHHAVRQRATEPTRPDNDTEPKPNTTHPANSIRNGHPHTDLPLRYTDTERPTP